MFLDFLSMAILSLHTRYIFTNFKSTLIIRVLEYWVKLILLFKNKDYIVLRDINIDTF